MLGSRVYYTRPGDWYKNKGIIMSNNLTKLVRLINIVTLRVIVTLTWQKQVYIGKVKLFNEVETDCL